MYRWKSLVSILLLVIVSLGLMPAAPAYAESAETAQDVELAYAPCQCTGYAWSRRRDLPSSGLGHAKDWARNAAKDQDGRRYSVGSLPSRNAVVVFQPGEQHAHASLGHVAYVEYAHSESRYQITEKNWYADPCRIHERDARTNPGQVAFIYQPIRVGETKRGAIARSYTRDRYGFWGRAGDVVTIRLNMRGSFDPYVYLRDPSGNVIVQNDDGGPGLNSLIHNYRLPRTGGYTIDAAGWTRRTGGYSLSLEGGGSRRPSGNLAQGARATASSIENGSLAPVRAVDGRMDTRWSSAHGRRSNWLRVDLRQAYDVTSARLRWETAYASRYWLCYRKPSDGRWWGWRLTHRGGTDDYRMPGVRHYQSWLVLEIDRPGNWANISLWEFELYGPGSGPSAHGPAPHGKDHSKIEGALSSEDGQSEPIELGEPVPVPEEIVRQFRADALKVPALRDEILKAQGR